MIIWIWIQLKRTNTRGSKWKFIMKRNASCIFLHWDRWRGEYKENEQSQNCCAAGSFIAIYFQIIATAQKNKDDDMMMVLLLSLEFFFISLVRLFGCLVVWFFGCSVACRCHLSVSRHKIVEAPVLRIFAKNFFLVGELHSVVSAVISLCWMGRNVMLLRICV